MTPPHFLFPSNPLQPKEADDIFQEQAQVFREFGHGVSLFSLEELQLGRFHLYGEIPADATVVYRGWMVSGPEYDSLAKSIQSRGGRPLTSPEAYRTCHYLPNWYPLVEQLTPETRVFPTDANLTAELSTLGWGKFFLKDYVKSLKTSAGSVVSKPEDAQVVVSEMEKFRGTIEGGVCVRRFEAFRPDSETRYFVIRGVPHAALGEPPDIVWECARRIPSPFFAVDIAFREDGVLRVVEIGDGQVSDLVGWQARVFGRLWSEEAG